MWTSTKNGNKWWEGCNHTWITILAGIASVFFSFEAKKIVLVQRRRKKNRFRAHKNPHHGMTRRTSQKQDCWEVIKGPLFSRKVPKFFLFPFSSFQHGHHNFYPCRFTTADCNVQCIWVSSPDSLRPKKSEMRFWLLPSSRLQKAGGKVIFF